MVRTIKHKGEPRSFEILVRKLRPYIPFSALNTVWRKLDKSSRTILDVGCGKGEPMAFINRQGRHLEKEEGYRHNSL